MLANCDEPLLLTEVRKALTGLTLIERRVLGDRFGLERAAGISRSAAVAAGIAQVTDASVLRWVERRALRKLRTAGMVLRDESATPRPPRRTAVIVPLHGPRPSVEIRPREVEPDPERPDNSLWDEA